MFCLLLFVFVVFCFNFVELFIFSTQPDMLANLDWNIIFSKNVSQTTQASQKLHPQLIPPSICPSYRYLVWCQPSNKDMILGDMSRTWDKRYVQLYELTSSPNNERPDCYNNITIDINPCPVRNNLKVIRREFILRSLDQWLVLGSKLFKIIQV